MSAITESAVRRKAAELGWQLVKYHKGHEDYQQYGPYALVPVEGHRLVGLTLRDADEELDAYELIAEAILAGVKVGFE